MSSPAAATIENAPPRPPGAWGAILTTTPVVLTVLATAFAGLSSSEMTRSMYYRSLAAQNQAKASDQWAFFQAKRIRGTSLEMTVELLQNLAHPQPFSLQQLEIENEHGLQVLRNAPFGRGSVRGGNPSAAAVQQAQAACDKLMSLTTDARTKQALQYLTTPALPKIEPLVLAKAEPREAILAVAKAISQRRPETEIADMVRLIAPEKIDESIRLAEENA